MTFAIFACIHIPFHFMMHNIHRCENCIADWRADMLKTIFRQRFRENTVGVSIICIIMAHDIRCMPTWFARILLRWKEVVQYQIPISIIILTHSFFKIMQYLNQKTKTGIASQINLWSSLTSYLPVWSMKIDILWDNKGSKLK